MKALSLISLLLVLPLNGLAQKHVQLPHGMLFGHKVDSTGVMPASKLETFMSIKPRILTTIKGRVVNVDTSKGGWFKMDAGKGKVIRVHFQSYNVDLPKALKNRTVMIQGIAQKQMIADDLQHYAGDTVVGKKQHQARVDPRYRLTFEATGLLVL